LSMYGGSFSTQGGTTVAGTIRGAGMVGGPIGGSGILTAEHGTLDLTGIVASGLTFQIASYGDLKIDGTPTTAHSVGMGDVNQVLEIGPSGSLTITVQESDTGGTIKLEGGTLTDAQGFVTGSYTTIAGFGTINGTEYGLHYGRGATIHATGGTLTLNGDIYSAISPTSRRVGPSTFWGPPRSTPFSFPPPPPSFPFLSAAPGPLPSAPPPPRKPSRPTPPST